MKMDDPMGQSTSQNYFKPLKYKDLTIEGNILAAPLAGFSDRAYRHISAEYGASLTYTEMVSSEALYRDSNKTFDLLERAEVEQEYAVQLFTGTPVNVPKAVSHVVPYKPLLIDLNCGCPVPKVLKSGSGAALMEFPEKVYDIVKALTESSSIPVTVKIRSGLRADSLTFIKVTQQAQLAGARLVTLHPRTRTQGYSGHADWSLIKQLKENVDIPVVGSGDLFSAEDALRMMEQTGCDGVMIARGAIGNPFIFDRIKKLFKGESLPELTPRERILGAIKHLELAFHYYSESYAYKEMRKHVCTYTKGLPGSSQVRRSLVKCESLEEYLEVLKPLLDQS